MYSTILVIEDDADCRDMLVLLLEQEGYNVLAAGDGAAGLAQARDQPPDLILTDISMPLLSGIEMIRRLRDEAAFENLPILVLTADTDSQDAALGAGANRVFLKPTFLDALLEQIAGLLDRTTNRL